jgi:hypothetical protein
VPFFFYKLTGKKKEDIHNAVLEQRERMAEQQGGVTEDASDENANPEDGTEDRR